MVRLQPNERRNVRVILQDITKLNKKKQGGDILIAD